MKVLDFKKDFSSLSDIDKRNYLKDLLNDNSLKVVLNSLIVNNTDIIENFEIINFLSKTKVYREKNNINNLELISLIIDLYIKNNKTIELQKYFNKIDKKKLKTIINYETNNKTNFTKLKLFNKLSKEVNNQKTNNHKKKLEVEKIDIKKNKSFLKKEIKSKKVKVSVFFIIFISILTILYILTGYSYYIINFYNSHVYPNIYLNNKSISGLSHDEFIEMINIENDILKENITFKNQNDNYTYSYENIGYSVNIDELKNNVINNYKKLNGFQKLSKILLDGKKDYKVKYLLNDEIYNNFLDELRSNVNVQKTNEVFYIKNGNINYNKGLNGFILDDSSLKDDIENSLRTDIREITLKGNIETTNNSLSVINKKISTFTTYYNESLGRARNIRNAVSRLNGKIIYPGEVFSFYRAVGPYNGAHGYIFYDKDVGSGVCQVSTTIYNAALLLNLPIVSRENHGDMVYYVDYGMDATVYGSSVDMKFKNNSNYPIYVEASAYGGTLTVSLWSNEGVLANGYTYKPRVERLGGLSFKTYIDTYKDGIYINSKYLNSSYYVKGK